MSSVDLMAKISNLKSIRKDYSNIIDIFEEEIKCIKNMEHILYFLKEKTKLQNMIKILDQNIRSMETEFAETIYNVEEV